jgi:hypothetical protein
MEAQHFAYVFAIAAGLASAGITSTLWTLIAGEELRLALPRKAGVDGLLRMLAIGIYAPLGIVQAGLAYLNRNPILALIILALGLGWSFLQGVFILTQFFGVQ